jgi:hypothetical protein
MASVAPKPISNIAVAFATQAAPGDNPRERDTGFGDGPDNTKHRPDMLLTPPNSLSPTLSPHKHRPGVPATRTPQPPSQFDSDIDLQDAVEHAAAQDQPTALSRAALSGLEAAGAITPTMLAKHHLPEILLLHGPMAIRHVLNHLAQSVPGFSRIPPAKARRLVVAALESRGGGGMNGEVEFEKVGWGRWDARGKGQPSRDGRPSNSVPIGRHGLSSGMSPPASIPESYAVSSVGGLQIPHAGRYKRDIYSGSWAGESILSSRDEDMVDMNMAEHEADKMSLDGSDPDSASDTSDMAEDMPGLEEDLDDVTDHEDWSAIGPDALRQGNHSYRRRYAHRDYNYLSRTSGARAKPQHRSVSAQSVPCIRAGNRTPAFNNPSSSLASRVHTGGLLASSNGVSGVIGQDSQEREAIEALLRMGSM